jgi:hypothetical protein
VCYTPQLGTRQVGWSSRARYALVGGEFFRLSIDVCFTDLDTSLLQRANEELCLDQLFEYLAGRGRRGATGQKSQPIAELSDRNGLVAYRSR